MRTRGVNVDLGALGLIPRGANRSTSSSSATPDIAHPNKRIKRSHTLSGSAPSPPSSVAPKSPSRSGSAPTVKDRRKSQPLAQATPPPSPDDYPNGTIDWSAIDDDIVLAVIEQLENCGNRPHLIKELAAILAQNKVPSVLSSANPVAIISSRLTSFLRKYESASVCPVQKELVNGRSYWFLNGVPRQNIPKAPDANLLKTARIISPSISSGQDDREQSVPAVAHEEYPTREEREVLSPSPELDLSAADFYSGHHGHSMSAMSFNEPSNYPDLYGAAYRNAASPPLEHEEREFEQTVNDMATLKASEQAVTPRSMMDMPSANEVNQHPSDHFLAMGDAVAVEQAMPGQTEETEEMRHQRNHEAASALFGSDYGRLHVNTASHLQLTSSPMMRPSIGSRNMPPPPPMSGSCFKHVDDDAAWNELKSPDCVELSEIDDLLGES